MGGGGGGNMTTHGNSSLWLCCVNCPQVSLEKGAGPWQSVSLLDTSHPSPACWCRCLTCLQCDCRTWFVYSLHPSPPGAEKLWAGPGPALGLPGHDRCWRLSCQAAGTLRQALQVTGRCTGKRILCPVVMCIVTCYAVHSVTLLWPVVCCV